MPSCSMQEWLALLDVTTSKETAVPRWKVLLGSHDKGNKKIKSHGLIIDLLNKAAKEGSQSGGGEVDVVGSAHDIARVRHVA